MRICFDNLFVGKVSTESKRSLRKTIIEESCVGDEAKINAESDCLMQIAVNDKSIENHFQPSTNDRMKVSADKKHTSGGHKQADLLCETAIIPLPEDQAAETVPSKRVRQSKNLLSNGHEAMSKLVDSESQYQIMCWNKCYIGVYILMFSLLSNQCFVEVLV